MKKVLIVTTIHTHPTNMGNSFAILAQANKLIEMGCDVHLLYVQWHVKNDKELRENAEILQLMRRQWGEKLHFYMASALVRKIRNLRYLISSKMRNWHMDLYQLYPYGVEKKVKELQCNYRFDLCIVNYVFMTKVFDYVHFPQMACFTHDTYAYKNQHAGKNNLWITADQEALGLQKCTDVLAIQEEEMCYFKILAPRSRHYNVYTPFSYVPQPMTGNHNIVFFSGRNDFNKNGLSWFVQDIFPMILHRFPDVKLIIGGSICKSVEAEYKGKDGILLYGFVDNPKDFFALADVAINPTYQGTGLKIKTFESIAYDKVTLVHPHSVTGIYDKQNAPLFASDKPEEWVDFLVGLWSVSNNILATKNKNRVYMAQYNGFIDSEYKRLINVQ